MGRGVREVSELYVTDLKMPIPAFFVPLPIAPTSLTFCPLFICLDSSAYHSAGHALV